ncbi:hypothetical protein GIB67_020221 [Kingdonia uniflora]|uniref:Aminotransferase-like plant mobile domain-containing protein n=1 Tax=Kingdonia uniflora TaxID=39325 RepID=A0A7J7P3L2_9MAGN|nr:hypothetical protein GIB67_020221 [Kingdonia uniflora]
MPNRDKLQCRGLLDKELKWYQWIAVYPTLKKLVNDMGFEEFCSINTGNSDNRLIHALVERWWPSTHTLHFPCGELGFTPLDFVILTGISFRRGRELPHDERYSKLEEVEKMFPGITNSDIRYSNITLSYLKKLKELLNPLLHNYNSQMDILYARAFIAYMMGNLFFSNDSTSLRVGYLAALIDYDILATSPFDWGTPIMEALYRGLDEVSVLRDGKVKKSITGFYAMLEFWFFEYCRVGMYLVKGINPSSGKSCYSAELLEGSIGVSPIRTRYDRELYQGLKDVDFYDGRDYLALDVDYMTYWRAVHPNPKIDCSLVKRAGNIWIIGRDLVSPDVHLSPTSSLATSSQVQDYGVHATGDPHNMRWFMDVAETIDQRTRIPILVMQVPYPCLPTYYMDELWHQNHGMRYAAYEDSRILVNRNFEL